MSDLRFSFPACVIAGKGRITPDDVLHLRRQLWPDGLGSRQEVAMALALHDCCPVSCPEWTGYLIESVTAYVVWHESRSGEVSGSTAGWLLEWLADAGAIRTSAGLDILLHVLDVATSVPNFLSTTALNQLRLALLPEPRGAYAGRRSGAAGITKQDLAFLWRVLRSAVDRGHLNLSRAERLILKEIDRLGAPAEHHPGWREMMSLTEMVAQDRSLSTAACRLSRGAEGAALPRDRARNPQAAAMAPDRDLEPSLFASAGA
nr:hypothetical protein REQ54_01472 [Rhizobium sp. Q54]